MCKSPLHPFLHALPKCEHHMHLEGSLSPPLLFRLAQQNSIALPNPTIDPSFTSATTLSARYARGFNSLDDFLHYYFIGQGVLLHASDYEALAWEYFQRAHADGVLHAEVFFDPQAHTDRGVAYPTVVAGFNTARRRAQEELGMSTELILCFLRHLPVQSAEQTFDAARPDFVNGTLAGIGLDSSEIDFPPLLFEGVYKAAEKLEGITVRRTAHAGEEAGADYIWQALDSLGVERVDHGIRLAEDEELMARVARQKTLFTVCPLSNVSLKCVKSVKDIPIRTFLDKGVRFSINSDDPAYFGGYILANYCAVQEAFGLTIQEWEKIVMASIEGSWCGEKRKEELVKRSQEVLRQYKGLADS
ncbi:MAG: adenine deaminase [Pycnora praestabilis]|nr:MAG: adenine deaminase [Pycnora praestabilis]